MKTIKAKLIAVAGSLGALCVLCCTLPILGLVGLGAYEALFCENTTLQIAGAAVALGAGGYFIFKKWGRGGCAANSCATGCACSAA